MSRRITLAKCNFSRWAWPFLRTGGVRNAHDQRNGGMEEMQARCDPISVLLLQSAPHHFVCCFCVRGVIYSSKVTLMKGISVSKDNLSGIWNVAPDGLFGPHGATD